MKCPCMAPCGSAKMLALVAEVGRLQRFGSGERLWRQGAPSETVVLVCRGALTSVAERSSTGGQSAILVTPGSIVGMEEILDARPRASTVEAIVASAGFVVGHAELLGRLREGGDAALAVLEMHALAQGPARAETLDFATSPVEDRVNRILGQLARRCGHPDARGTFVPVPMRRTLLARLVGCRPETLVRLLKTPPFSDEVIFVREGFVLARERPAEGSSAA